MLSFYRSRLDRAVLIRLNESNFFKEGGGDRWLELPSEMDQIELNLERSELSELIGTVVDRVQRGNDLCYYRCFA